MKARGFARATTGADLHVHYYMLATVGQSAQVAGQFLPPVTAWGLPPFASMTTALSTYPVGTLVLDISSAASKSIVWRGAAERKMNLERSDSERKKVLEKAITDLLKQFPPKPKKK
jgi:hypothetical protein